MKSRETTSALVIVFASLYMIGITLTGLVDTLSSGGTDRIFQNAEMVVLFYSPLIVLAVIYTAIYSKDRRTKSDYD